MISKDDVSEKLKDIIDPELHVNIIDLGLVYDIGIDQEVGKVTITMTLTSPGCPLSQVFEEWIPAAVKRIDEVKDVKIKLVWEPPWDPENMTDDAKDIMGWM